MNLSTAIALFTLFFFQFGGPDLLTPTATKKKVATESQPLLSSDMVSTAVQLSNKVSANASQTLGDKTAKRYRS